MSDSLRSEYTSKYFRQAEQVMQPAAKNPVPAMKYDSVILKSTPDFGGLGTEINWEYICEPVQFFPEPVKNDHERYIILMSGNMINMLELGGEVEITIGKSEDDMHVFKYAECVAALIEEGMYYNINFTKIDDPKHPILFNQTIFNAV